MSETEGGVHITGGLVVWPTARRTGPMNPLNLSRCWANVPRGHKRCYASFMVGPRRALLFVIAFAAPTMHAQDTSWSTAIPSEQREALAKRLDAYLRANRSQDWKALYGFISEAGRGGTNPQTFVRRMRETHRKDFASGPDLLKFEPARSVNESGFDIYGCGKAQREGREFNGVAVVHAVFEHGDWYFSGWAFTEFPNEPCKALSSPTWEMPGPMEWNQPLEELRGLGETPVHVDGAKK